MCVLQPCANPTEAGVWWRDDTKWCLYGANHQSLIRNGIKNKLLQIDLGSIVSKVHPNGARYLVDLTKMEQVAVNSKQRRSVMVIDTVSAQSLQSKTPPQATLIPTPPSPPRNLSLNLHYRDSQGNLQQYDPYVAQAIFNAYTSNQRTLLVPCVSGHRFFDLGAMVQHFVSHFVNGEAILSDEPPVQIIAEVPWDATAMASLAAKADKCLRRKILVMAIDRYRSDDRLDTILPMKASPRKVVSKCISTYPAERFEKFVDSVEEILYTFPDDIMGDLIKFAGSEVGKGPVQLAFKPAKLSKASSRASSSRHGSDTTSVTRTSLWMSMAAPAAAAHAVVYGCTVQVLAYLVILPPCTWRNLRRKTDDGCSGHVVVDRSEHQLPLAEVTVR